MWLPRTWASVTNAIYAAKASRRAELSLRTKGTITQNRPKSLSFSFARSFDASKRNCYEKKHFSTKKILGLIKYSKFISNNRNEFNWEKKQSFF